MYDLYETKISDGRWWAYDIPVMPDGSSISFALFLQVFSIRDIEKRKIIAIQRLKRNDIKKPVVKDFGHFPCGVCACRVDLFIVLIKNRTGEF